MNDPEPEDTREDHKERLAAFGIDLDAAEVRFRGHLERLEAEARHRGQKKADLTDVGSASPAHCRPWPHRAGVAATIPQPTPLTPEPCDDPPGPLPGASPLETR